MRDPYWRQGTDRKVVDGDTIDFQVDLGFRMTTEQRFRLLGVDTPELRSRDIKERSAAREAKRFVEEWLVDHKSHAAEERFPWLLQTRKADSFGRWLAVVHCGEGHSLTQDLLDNGHAVEYPKRDG